MFHYHHILIHILHNNNNNIENFIINDPLIILPEEPEVLQERIDEYDKLTVELDNKLDKKIEDQNNKKCQEINFSPLKDFQFPKIKSTNSGFECSARGGEWNRNENTCCNARKLQDDINEHYDKIIKYNQHTSIYGFDSDENKEKIDGISKDTFIKLPLQIQRALTINNNKFLNFTTSS